MFLFGCSKSPQSYNIKVNAIQDAVKVEVQNQIYTTPAEINIKPAYKVEIIFYKECYISTTITLAPKVKSGAVFNVMAFPVWSIAGVVNGDIVEFDESRPISVDLQKDTTNPECKDFFNTKKINK